MWCRGASGCGESGWASASKVESSVEGEGESQIALTLTLCHLNYMIRFTTFRLALHSRIVLL